ncbi:MAG: class I SAM-dependent methyltransferase, partial [Spirochaetia bacterium]
MNLIMFPFDRVNKGATIAIYGAGEISKSFLNQLSAINYCRVDWLVDQKFESKGQQGKLICLPPNMMDWQQPEQIIIA